MLPDIQRNCVTDLSTRNRDRSLSLLKAYITEEQDGAESLSSTGAGVPISRRQLANSDLYDPLGGSYASHHLTMQNLLPASQSGDTRWACFLRPAVFASPRLRRPTPHESEGEISAQASDQRRVRRSLWSREIWFAANLAVGRRGSSLGSQKLCQVLCAKLTAPWLVYLPVQVDKSPAKGAEQRVGRCCYPRGEELEHELDDIRCAYCYPTMTTDIPSEHYEGRHRMARPVAERRRDEPSDRGDSHLGSAGDARRPSHHFANHLEACLSF